MYCVVSNVNTGTTGILNTNHRISSVLKRKGVKDPKLRSFDRKVQGDKYKQQIEMLTHREKIICVHVARQLFNRERKGTNRHVLCIDFDLVHVCCYKTCGHKKY